MLSDVLPAADAHGHISVMAVNINTISCRKKNYYGFSKTIRITPIIRN